MKKLLIVLIVLIGLLAVTYAFGVWDKEYDLGELKEVPYDAKLTYCIYTITSDPCDKSRFKKGNQICIRCCTTRKSPWPLKINQNFVCPKFIEFEEAANGCDLEAKRVGQSCTACNPKTSSGVFECPNP